MHDRNAPRQQSAPSKRPLTWLLLALAGCAGAADGDMHGDAIETALDSQQTDLLNERHVLCEGIVAAENLLLTSDERLFATGDEGIFELVLAQDKSARPVAWAKADDCSFGGIVETHGMLYANCYASPDSFLYAATLNGAPQFQRIRTLEGIELANGLTADPEGNLYVAATFQDQILKLELSASDPWKVAAQTPFLTGSGLFTNGLKYYEGTLYWTDSTTVRKVALQADGSPGTPEEVATRLTFFDDLFVDAQGILVADYLWGTIRNLNQFDPVVGLTSPSAVIRAGGRAGFAADDLIVTEKGADRVSVIGKGR